MRTMSVKAAKNPFGELPVDTQKAHWTIERNGGPSAPSFGPSSKKFGCTGGKA